MPHSAGKGAKQGRATATCDEAAATGRPGKHASVDVALPLSTPPDAWTPTALSTRSRTLSAANARNRANPICLDSDDNDRPGFKEKRRYIMHGKAQYGDAMYFRCWIGCIQTAMQMPDRMYPDSHMIESLDWMQ